VSKTDDFGQMLVQGLLRATAGSLAMTLGDAQTREAVGRLFDDGTPEDEKQRIRDGLDGLAKKLFE
jgi:hypothetical protein